eukprot:Rmarinus@m.4439
MPGVTDLEIESVDHVLGDFMASFEKRCEEVKDLLLQQPTIPPVKKRIQRKFAPTRISSYTPSIDTSFLTAAREAWGPRDERDEHQRKKKDPIFHVEMENPRWGPQITSHTELLYFMQKNKNLRVEELLQRVVECPSRRVLMEAESIGNETGWKDGYLSSSWGFVHPVPNKSFGHLRTTRGVAWIMMAQRMPGLMRTCKVREALRRMPVIGGDSVTIPDLALSAAASCLSILAQSYRYECDQFSNENEEFALPDSVKRPWFLVCERLGRPGAHMSYTDATIENGYVIDHTQEQPWTLDNLRFAFPAFGNAAERVFVLVQTHMLGVFGPAIEEIVRCQECCMSEDYAGALKALVKIKRYIDAMVPILHQISVNPLSGTYVDPIVWGKTFAKWSGPWGEGVPGLSGFMNPLFHVLDSFIGRKKYDSFLGKEAAHLRAWMPSNWKNFIDAVSKFPITKFLADNENTDNPDIKQMSGVMQGLLDGYAGERGFLGAHRYKTYGFIELVMKTGRTKTNGGALTGSNSWDALHAELEKSRVERFETYYGSDGKTVSANDRGTYCECPFAATVVSRESIDQDPNGTVRKVVLSIRGSGMTYDPGDRIALLPTNRLELVFRTVRAMKMDPRTNVHLTRAWTDFFRHLAWVLDDKDMKEAVENKQINILSLLRHARLRPLRRIDFERLHRSVEEGKAYGSNNTVTGVALRENVFPHRLPYWEVVEQLAREEVDLSAVFQPKGLSAMLEPEPTRTYSISSAPPSGDAILPSEIHLTVSRAEFQDKTGKIYGTGSSCVNPPMKRPAELDDILINYPWAEKHDKKMLIGVSKPFMFELPKSNWVPVVMFSAGSGIGPFRSFLQHRVMQGMGAENWLFFGTIGRENLLYQTELFELCRKGFLQLRVAFSREDYSVIQGEPTLAGGYEPMVMPGRRGYLDRAMTEPETAARLWTLMQPREQGGEGAYFYICGRVELYTTVMNALKKIIRMNGGNEEVVMARIFAARRLMSEVYMSPRSQLPDDRFFSVSEIVLHNNKENGYWMLVDDMVYDVTDFLPMHPGGIRIIREHCGRDCTRTFMQVSHHNNPEVISLLNAYTFGRVRKLELEAEHEPIYRQWLSYLFAVVEIENTLTNEFESHRQSAEFEGVGQFSTMGYMKQYVHSHKRMLDVVVPGIFGIDFKMLFSLSAAPLVVMEHGVTAAVINEIDAIFINPYAWSTKLMLEVVTDWLQEDINVVHLNDKFGKMQDYCSYIIHVDTEFLRRIKMCIREGVMVYENSGGPEAVFDIFQRLRDCVVEYYRALAAFEPLQVEVKRRTASVEPPPPHAKAFHERPLAVLDLINMAVGFATDMQHAKKEGNERFSDEEEMLNAGAFARFADPDHSAADFESQMLTAATILKALPPTMEITETTLMAQRWMVRQDLKEMFDRVDLDGSGSIEREEVLDMLNEPLEDDKSGEIQRGLIFLRDHFDQIDTDGSGSIEFDEFFDFWMDQRSREDRAMLCLQRAAKRWYRRKHGRPMPKPDSASQARRAHRRR